MSINAENIKINLLASPRNVSTAFMYSWAQRLDTLVFDEPFYAHYLNWSGKIHPGTEEILKAQSKNAEEVIENVINKKHSRKIAFFKQMSHHLSGFDISFLNDCKNIIFIRNPKLIINSYAKVRAEIDHEDIGIKKQLALFKLIKNPIVLDSKSLLQNPEKCLKKLCAKLEVPFFEEMLNWQKGPKSYDGVWAKYWYKNVHQSTRFKAFKEEKVIVPEKHKDLLEECKPLYLNLLSKAI